MILHLSFTLRVPWCVGFAGAGHEGLTLVNTRCPTVPSAAVFQPLSLSALPASQSLSISLQFLSTSLLAPWALCVPVYVSASLCLCTFQPLGLCLSLPLSLSLCLSWPLCPHFSTSISISVSLCLHPAVPPTTLCCNPGWSLEPPPCAGQVWSVGVSIVPGQAWAGVGAPGNRAGRQFSGRRRCPGIPGTRSTGERVHETLTDRAVL